MAAVVGVVGIVLGAIWEHSRSSQSGSWSVPENAAARFLGKRTAGGDDLNVRIATVGMAGEDLWAVVSNSALSWAERSIPLQKLASVVGVDSARRLMALFLTEPSSTQGAFARVMSDARCVGFLQTLELLLEDGDDTHAAAAIRGLAGIGGDDALQWLADIMNDEAWPEALRREAAVGLLGQGNPRIATIAISGLAAIGSEASRAELSGLLNHTTTDQTLRLHAAAALGQIGSPQAAQDLTEAFTLFPGEDEQTQLLEALGHCPFPLIENQFRGYLADSSTPADLRVAAAEALANTTVDALPLLQSLAASDADAAVREMAAWAISTRAPGGPLGPELARMIYAEPEPDVRRRLYEGLLVQAESPADSLLPAILAEEDPAARVAAFNAVGDAVGRGHSASLSGRFDAEMAPELEAVALGDSSLNLRMRAVFALRRAGTPAARDALTRISSTPTPEIAKAASNGLLAKK